jgi:asparagine synthase (glutamine-hydrolysing)
MCGIAGVIGRVDDRNRAALAKMSHAITHRGPDSEGTWASEADGNGWGCLLAFRRLAILDLSSAGDQPMVDPSGHALVYNGELYSYGELRSSLQARGESFTSTGDTAVLLRAMALDGLDALPHLRGMFGFGLWDPRARTLTLARDPHGMKPLYIAKNPDPNGAWSLLFASELRAILRSGLLDRPRLDPTAVASMVWNGFVVGPGTAVAGVEQLTAGSAAVFDDRGKAVATRRFWTRGSSSNDLASALRTGVQQHLASDVPLGVFLSSGIDSSAVANLAAAGHDGLQTFTLAFEEKTHDESEAARAIAAAIGTDHHEIVLSGADFGAQLSKAIDTIDQPTFDGLNTLFMSRAVREAGITVALVGTGGDELFGGYETFRQLPKVAGLGWVPGRRAIAALLRLGARNGGPVPAQTRWAKLPGMVAGAGDLVSLYQLGYALFLPTFQRRLLQPGIDPLEDGLPASTADELRAAVKGAHPLAGISTLEQKLFLGERLLRDSDAASMATSLELRLPLVDSVLTSTVEAMPVGERYEPVGRKAALRRAGLGGLDPALFDRPKQGFVLPFDHWLRGPLREQVGSVLHDRDACDRVGLDVGTTGALWDAYVGDAPGLYWSRPWALYVLAAWADANGVSL